MKKFLFVVSLFLMAFSLFAQQEPLMKIYMEDGSTKQYNISEIENISVLTGSGNYIMNIYEKGNKLSNFPTKEIESIKFENDVSNNQVLNIYISGKPNGFKLLEMDSINFKISEEPLPQITSINPTSGQIGDEITIIGKNFGDTQSSSFVSFNGTNATTYTNWSSTEIKVKVPTGATSGKLFVMVNNKKSNEVDFTIMLPNQPQIISINPKAVNIGDILTITGKNFGSSQGAGFATFNGINASDYTGWSDTEIKVKVTAGTKSGKVSVTANGVKSNEVDFTILPFITSIKPASAKIGDIIEIIGNNFGANQGPSFIYLNGVEIYEFTSWNDTLIKVRIPEGTVSGKLSVTVYTYKSNEVDFKIIPQITSIEPTSAMIGDEITITGISFGATQGTDSVYFNGIKAGEYTSWSDIEIKVKVPIGAVTGKVLVSIKGVNSNEMDFAVIPYITSITPTSARIGDEIKIKGNGFDKKSGASTVSFTGVDTKIITSWNPTEIVLNVPVGAETGKVSVTAGSEKSNEVDFTVLPKITGISPSKLMPGGEITINGYCFANEQGTSTVSFNDIDATEIISWSATQIIVKVPAGAVSGKLSVTINGNKSNEVDYKIVDLYIESISPSSAYVGDEVTISGFGFGSTRGSSIVSFKSKDASEYTSWTDKEIKVKVPKGAKTGKVYLTIKGQMSNEYDFTVGSGSGTYEEVTIGDQVWMLKNLDVTTYRNGDEIPEVISKTDWENLTTGAWCYYNNDPANGEVYGKLYNWYAVNDSRGLAAEGWHVPSDAEWTTLTDYLGGEGVAGGKMKVTGTAYWKSPNEGATNECGFSALPGGFRFNYGTYSSIGDYGNWWSSTEHLATNAWYRYLSCITADIGRYYYGKGSGFSVRCVKD